jgi:hypothetical protein
MGTAADAARAFMACVPGADAPGSRRLRRCAAGPDPRRLLIRMTDAVNGQTCVPGADAPGSRRLRRCAACSGPIGVARPSALCSDDTRDKREGADEIAIHLAIDCRRIRRCLLPAMFQ